MMNWQPSKNGNPTCVVGNRRYTVYPVDTQYKFIVFKNNSDQKPFDSEPYDTQHEAKSACADYIRTSVPVHGKRCPVCLEPGGDPCLSCMTRAMRNR